MTYNITIYNNNDPLNSVTFPVSGDEAAFETYEKIREILETVNGHAYLWANLETEIA